MAWTVPITFYNNDPLTAAQLNNFIRNNMLETGPGKAKIGSRMLVTAEHNSIVERQWARAYAGTNITLEGGFPTTEDPEGNLWGPTVTVEHGGRVLLLYDAKVVVTAGGGNAIYAPAIDGSSPETTSYALRSAREGVMRAGAMYLAEYDSPGVSTITMAYGTSNRVTTAAYDNRRLTAFPL